MRSLPRERLAYVESVLAELPRDLVRELREISGDNGAQLATDEAAAWKRVLSYRIAKYLQPRRILETHAGLHVGTRVYKRAAHAEIISLDRFNAASTLPVASCDLVDVDPNGACWDALVYARRCLKSNGVLLVTNGEALMVSRRMLAHVKHCEHAAEGVVTWAEQDCIPRLERETGLSAQFHYVFPTSLRVVLSNAELPRALFADCPVRMWYLARERNVSGTRKERGWFE
jgi:hypothetical protein